VGLDENVLEHNASVELASSNSYKTLHYGLPQRFLKCGGRLNNGEDKSSKEYVTTHVA
jgi:hypothetical protein